MFDLLGHSPPRRASRAAARPAELEKRLDRLRTIATSLWITGEQLHRVLLANLGLFWWDAAFPTT
jgi:hypothetical protein